VIRAGLAVGTEVPRLERSPDPVDLFSFSAAAWLLHRIHYDLPFTTEHDGHPGLLIHGPLQGTYMIQSVQWWLGPEAELRSIAYRHSNPAYCGDTLTCGGTVTAIDEANQTFDVDLWVEKRPADEPPDAASNEGRSSGDAATVTTSGTATFSLPADSMAGTD